MQLRGMFNFAPAIEMFLTAASNAKQRQVQVI